MQIICNWLKKRVFSDIFNIGEKWNVRKLGEIYKNLDLYYPKTYMCRYSVNQNLLVLNLYNGLINNILAMESITVKSSQNLNLM